MSSTSGVHNHQSVDHYLPIRKTNIYQHFISFDYNDRNLHRSLCPTLDSTWVTPVPHTEPSENEQKTIITALSRGETQWWGAEDKTQNKRQYLQENAMNPI